MSRDKFTRLWGASSKGPNHQPTKVELLEHVKNIDHPPSYTIKKITEENGSQIIFKTPPYHCELQPIEMIWGIIKNMIAFNSQVSSDQPPDPGFVAQDDQTNAGVNAAEHGVEVTPSWEDLDVFEILNEPFPFEIPNEPYPFEIPNEPYPFEIPNEPYPFEIQGEPMYPFEADDSNSALPTSRNRLPIAHNRGLETGVG
ncbi:hypothetical protein BGX34_003850, partial [Mortierella sp. NVP85]